MAIWAHNKEKNAEQTEDQHFFSDPSDEVCRLVFSPHRVEKDRQADTENQRSRNISAGTSASHSAAGSSSAE